MFTGIIEDKGVIHEVKKSGSSLSLSLKTSIDTAKVGIGDSVSVNGACLTVVKIDGNILTFDVSFETAGLTNLKELKRNDNVNLERALSADGRFNGHIVSGHIDGIGNIAKKEKVGEFFKIRVSADENILRYVVKKGSIAVDGISLTVNDVDESGFEFVVIPQTLKMTTLGDKNVGAIVNLETDILAKYAEKLLKNNERENKIDTAFLARHGFI